MSPFSGVSLIFAWNHPRVLVDTDHVEENRHQTVQIVELHHMAMPWEPSQLRYDPGRLIYTDGSAQQVDGKITWVHITQVTLPFVNQ